MGQDEGLRGGVTGRVDRWVKWYAGRCERSTARKGVYHVGVKNAL